MKKYGVIVSCSDRRGLLLPDLEGVDTVEQQIDIARQKGRHRGAGEVRPGTVRGGAAHMICELCFHHCDLSEGQTGFCRARACRDGVTVSLNYGKLTRLALDPIEKKPLRRFHPRNHR